MKLDLKKNILNPKVILIIFAVGILAGLLSIIPLIKENSECQLNPLVYGAKIMEEETGPLLGTIVFENDQYDNIIFDSEEMVVQEKDRGQFKDNYKFNFTIPSS